MRVVWLLSYNCLLCPFVQVFLSKYPNEDLVLLAHFFLAQILQEYPNFPKESSVLKLVAIIAESESLVDSVSLINICNCNVYFRVPEV